VQILDSWGVENPKHSDCGGLYQRWRDEPGIPDDEPNKWVYWTPFSYPFNLTQQPACSVPCGFTEAGLPVGLQIVGPMHDDALVLLAAHAFEQAAPMERRPEL